MIIIFTANNPWNLFNFRKNLIKELIDCGHTVVALTPPGPYSKKLIEIGCRWTCVSLNPKTINPFSDVFCLIMYLQIYIRNRPDFIINYTIKCNIYSSIAARLLGIPYMCNVEGLGSMFTTDQTLRHGCNLERFVQSMVIQMYKVTISFAKYVVFLNNDDIADFDRLKIPIFGGLVKINGLGVNVSEFSVTKMPASISFTFIGRLLWDKGVGVFVDAARILKAKYKDVDFKIVGFVDCSTRRAISNADIEGWTCEGVIKYKGPTDNVFNAIADTTCIVLPTYYREGVPRVLLEAGACGRPTIATDWVGCRDVIVDKVTGYLCKPMDVNDLVLKMELMISLSNDERVEMGLKARARVESQFDELLVIEKYLNCIKSVEEKSSKGSE